MKGPIQSVEVTYFIHATEDPRKVGDALARVLEVTGRPAVERLEGHFGNEITKVKLHLTGEEAGGAFENLVARLPGNLRNELLAHIGTFLDEHSAFFLRLDKQLLVSGSLALGSADAVRVKVKPRVFLVRGGAARFYSGLIGGAKDG